MPNCCFFLTKKAAISHGPTSFRVTEPFVDPMVRPGPQSHLWMLLPLPQATGHRPRGSPGPWAASRVQCFQNLHTNPAKEPQSYWNPECLRAPPDQRETFIDGFRKPFLKRSQCVCKYHPFSAKPFHKVALSFLEGVIYLFPLPVQFLNGRERPGGQQGRGV